LVLELNMIPVVPPKSNRREPWDYDRELYKKRNQVERLFRRLKGFRRIFLVSRNSTLPQASQASPAKSQRRCRFPWNSNESAFLFG
jgi:transposase